MSLRGDKTKSDLLRIGAELFSYRGYNGVTTREIVDAAGTTLPSIAHHFGSKEGLYRAVLENLAKQMSSRFSTEMPQGTPAVKDLTRLQTVHALQQTMAGAARAVLYSPTEWTGLISHEQTSPTPAFRPVERVVEEHLMRPMVRLIAALQGSSPSSNQARIQAVLLLARVLAFRTRGSSMLRMLGWAELTSARIEAIVTALTSELEAMFPTEL